MSDKQVDGVLKKLDELIYHLSEEHGLHDWTIHLRGNLAEALFGSPIPKKYKHYPIIVNDDIQEVAITSTKEWLSDIWVVPLTEGQKESKK